MSYASQTAIYWYPMGTGTLETVTLPFITDLSDEDPEVVAATGETTAGGMFRQLYGDWRRVIVLRQHVRPEDATEKPVLQSLRSLQSHLIAGHSIGVAVGAQKAFGAFTVGYSRGVSTIGIPANAYAGWSTLSALAAGDEVVIQSPSPNGAREVMQIQAIVPIGTTFAVTFTRGLRYDHPGPVLVRFRTFYPHLKLPDDQLETPIITTSNRGRTFDLRLELREDQQETFTFGDSGQQLAGTGGDFHSTPQEIQNARLGNLV